MLAHLRWEEKKKDEVGTVDKMQYSKVKGKASAKSQQVKLDIESKGSELSQGWIKSLGVQ